jgi:hypothetical protein
MDRRTAVAAAGTIVIVAVLALAASSDSVRVWSNPPSANGPAPTVSRSPNTIEVPADTVAPDEEVAPPWGGSLLPYIGVAVLLLVLVLIVRMFSAWDRRQRWRQLARRRRLRQALPEIVETDLVVDRAAADEALATGVPRNAIVACWMQLERDASAAGLRRAPAETSLEFVERVVAASSVDPGPIRELAGLYREARFSQHEMGEADRERARVTLRQVVDAMRSSVVAPA